MGWVDRKEHYQAIARTIDPAIRLTTKDGWVWKAIAWILWAITFGRMPRSHFLEDYATTIGPIQAYPRSLETIGEGTLVHEGRHAKQFRWFGLGIHPWVGLPFMAIAYLLLPLPMGLAWLRYRLELDADREKWRHMLANGAPPHAVSAQAERFARKVSGPPYAWSWPRKWAIKGFLKAASKEIGRVSR